jgi:hypothetical protein
MAPLPRQANATTLVRGVRLPRYRVCNSIAGQATPACIVEK